MPILPKQKVIDTKCSFKELLLCRVLSSSINNSEISLKMFDDDVTVNSTS